MLAAPTSNPSIAPRRRHTLAAALAVSVIAAGVLVAVPASAATTGTSIRGYSNSKTVTVPAGVTEMDVVLQGGNGGAGQRPGNEPAPAGHGSTVTLTRVPVTAGQQVRLVGADNGGNTGSAGGGYVSGGSGGDASHNTARKGGGGGGASALLIDGVLVAIAGGGGGSGGGTHDTYTGGDRGGAGGTHTSGVTPDAPATAGLGGPMGVMNLAAPTAGGNGGNATAGLSAGGGGGGGGARGGAGGGAGNPGGGGGGGAGASAVLTELAGRTLTSQITAGTTNSGSVAVTWRYSVSVTIDSLPTLYAGGSVSVITNVTFPSGYDEGATYAVELDGHGSTGALSTYARNTWTLANLRVGTWTATITISPWDERMGATILTQQVTVLAGTTATAKLTAPSTVEVGSELSAAVTVGLRNPNSTAMLVRGGTVQLHVDGHPVGSPGTVYPALANSTHRWTPVAAGTYALTVVYTPNNPDIAAVTSSAVAVTVTPLATTLQVSAPATSRAGSPMEVTVSNTGGLSGTYAFSAATSDGWSQTDARTVTDGTPLTWASTNLPEGTVMLDVTFTPSDTTRYAASTARVTTVASRVATVVAIALEPTAKVAVPLTVTARVTANQSDTRVPTGTVTFEDAAGSVLAVTAPSRTGAGWAEFRFDMTRAAPGDVEVTATYSGSAQHEGAASAASSTTFTAWDTAATGTLSAGTTPVTRAVELRVAVSATEFNSPAITGSVRLTVDGVAVGTPVAVVGGVATLTVPSGLPIGSRTIGATFSDPTGTFVDASIAPVSLSVTRGALGGGAAPTLSTPGHANPIPEGGAHAPVDSGSGPPRDAAPGETDLEASESVSYDGRVDDLLPILGWGVLALVVVGGAGAAAIGGLRVMRRRG